VRGVSREGRLDVLVLERREIVVVSGTVGVAPDRTPQSVPRSRARASSVFMDNPRRYAVEVRERDAETPVGAFDVDGSLYDVKHHESLAPPSNAECHAREMAAHAITSSTSAVLTTPPRRR
jgi:hypothetical protein